MSLTSRCPGCRAAHPHQCAACKAYKRAWAAAHKKPYVATEKSRAQRHAYYLAHRHEWSVSSPEVQARAKKKYYETHKATVKARSKAWKAANPERVKTSSCKGIRSWRARNPTKVKAQKAAWKHRRRAAGPLKTSTVAAILLNSNGCVYCGSPGPLTLEHLLATTKGGTNEPANLKAACVSCNSSKQDKPWKLWFRKQAFYSVERERQIDGPCP